MKIEWTWEASRECVFTSEFDDCWPVTYKFGRKLDTYTCSIGNESYVLSAPMTIFESKRYSRIQFKKRFSGMSEDLVIGAGERSWFPRWHVPFGCDPNFLFSVSDSKQTVVVGSKSITFNGQRITSVDYDSCRCSIVSDVETEIPQFALPLFLCICVWEDKMRSEV